MSVRCGAVEDEEKNVRERSRAVRVGQGIFLEKISGGDQEEVNLRAAGRGIEVGAEKNTEWRQENKV